MANINMKINGNIQIDVDSDDNFEWYITNILDDIKEKVLSIHYDLVRENGLSIHCKGWESVKGSESISLPWLMNQDYIGEVEVNYERI
jgi:hypothetical protein